MTSAVLTVDAMRAAEQAAMDGGVSEWELMQRAGEGAAQWIWRMAAGRPVTVLCGPGNNGGDGHVIAEWLRAKGLQVQVVAPVEPKTDTARIAREGYQGRISQSASSISAPVLVDALFGYGLTRPLDGAFAQTLAEAAEAHTFKVAIDVPSGVASDSGELLGEVPHFDLTLALGAWKKAHFLMPARAVMGVTRLVPIGLDVDEGHLRVSDRPRLSAPTSSDHKYTRGLLGVVGGAMPGAPVLAAKAAMCAGAGYVKLFSRDEHANAPIDLVVEQDELSTLLSGGRFGALLIGPGLGRDDDARDRLAATLEAGFPAVIDADALHLLDWDMIEGVEASRLILTPHEGELAALCRSFDVAAENKLDRAKALRDAMGANVLAKGADTILATCEGETLFFPQGSSWLSVAGSGDVLAGIIAAQLAGGLAPAMAAEQGVWLHHEAARIAAPAFSASQLANAVKPAMAHFL